MSTRPLVRYRKLLAFQAAGTLPPVARAPELPRTPRLAPHQRLADSDLSYLTSGHKYACDDGCPATVYRSSSSRRAMANGFCPHDAADREISAERRPMRHSSNSFGASRRILADPARLFRNTTQ